MADNPVGIIAILNPIPSKLLLPDRHFPCIVKYGSALVDQAIADY